MNETSPKSAELFDLAYRYIARATDFDSLYLLALEEVPVLHHASPGSPAARLASLVVLLEAQQAAGEITKEEIWEAIFEYLRRSQDQYLRRYFADPPSVYSASSDDTHLCRRKRSVDLTL